nr:hypothetical protein [uncultured Butyrivibrio sp.]
MRRLAFISLTISGSVLLLFLANLLLFNYVPSYHDALEMAVAGDSQIPMVVIDENNEAVVIRRDEMTFGNSKASKAPSVLDTTEIGIDDSVPLSGTIDSSAQELEDEMVSGQQAEKDDAKVQEKCEKRVVDKKYYEDCGSDKGYWVITYEDGTTSIEK